jgi:hypothetical protein
VNFIVELHTELESVWFGYSPMLGV